MKGKKNRGDVAAASASIPCEGSTARRKRALPAREEAEVKEEEEKATVRRAVRCDPRRIDLPARVTHGDRAQGRCNLRNLFICLFCMTSST